MGSNMRSETDRTSAIIILICMAMVAVGCVLGISYLVEYNFYEKGDEGKTAKTIAFQIYSLDDLEHAQDYYSCYYEDKDSYRLNYYMDKFSTSRTNFMFYVTDNSNVVYYTNSDSGVSGVAAEFGQAEYRGSSSCFIYDEEGETIPLRINYYIPEINSDSVRDKYSSAFQWIEIADTLKYVLFFALGIAAIVIIIMLSQITINAGIKENETGEVEPGFIDRIPFDICLLFLLVVFAASWIIMGLTMAGDVDMVLNNVIIMILFVAVILVLMTFLTTLSVRVKMGKLYKNTVIYRIIRSFKRKTPRKIRRRIFKELSLFKKICIGVTLYIIAEAAILFTMTYLGIIGEVFEPMSVFGMFLVIWALSRLIMIPIITMVAINLNYIREEGQRLAEGVLGDEIATKLTIASFRAHGKNLDQIKKEINKAMEQEIKSERLKTELITNVSHDIKTPLTSIVSYVDLLGRAETTEEERAKYLDILDRHTKNLNNLLDELIEASKISSGNIEIELSRISLNIIIGQTVEEFADKFEKFYLLPRIMIPEEDVYIMGDGRWIWRILANLLNNACKYSAPETDVEIRLETDNGKAILSISNSVKEEINIDAQELTERFVRGDSSRHTEGSGLGLSITKILAELQDAQLEVEVEEDRFTAKLVFDIAVDKVQTKKKKSRSTEGKTN